MKRNTNYVLRTIGKKDFLVAIGPQVKKMNGIVMLSSTGSFIWSLLSHDQQMEDIAEAITKKFDVDFDEALEDAKTFLCELERLDSVDL